MDGQEIYFRNVLYTAELLSKKTIEQPNRQQAGINAIGSKFKPKAWNFCYINEYVMDSILYTFMTI